MGFYEDRILPRLLDLTMRQRRLVPYRHRVLTSAHGRVLEIGVGTGLNLPLYGPGLDRLCGIDPSPKLIGLAQQRKPSAVSPMFLSVADGQTLPFADASFDCVITTWTLCSIRDPMRALREMRRVLGPDGQLRFVEHGLSPDAGVRRWQNRLTPCWTRISGGCHLNRKIDDLIRTAGFGITDLHTGYMKGPRLMTFMYEGAASVRQSPA